MYYRYKNIDTRMLPNKGPAAAPTFSLESSLSKFPLPSIADSLSRYKRVALPFCQNEQDVQRLQSQMKKASTELQPIQDLLQQRFEQTENYVHLDWWTKYGYLEDRTPITPIESYQLHFGREYLTQLEPSKRNNIPIERRIAAMALNLSKFHSELVNEAIQIKGFSPKEPITMNQFRSLFECCRIPKPDFDEQVYHFKTKREGRAAEARFFMIGAKGRFYQVWLEDPSSGIPIGLESLALNISQIAKDANKPVGKDEFRNLGFFTGSKRDWWAEARTLLVNSDQANQQNFDIIERSLVMITLDESLPESDEEHLIQLSQSPDGGSRWYDKASQLVVFANGKTGFSMEHSVMDVASSFFMHEWCEERFVSLLETSHTQSEDTSRFSTATGGHFSKLQWRNVPYRVEELLELAKEEYLGRITRKEWKLKRARFNGIGRHNIKKQLGVSADSFFQMAFQDAYYRLYGRIPSTYESVGVLRFRFGRTETGRCASIESKEFVEASQSVDVDSDNQKLRELGQKLRKACAYHQQWIKDASEGKGFDRHFFAIRCLCREKGLSVPEFLSDPVFARASSWDLSTSNAFLDGPLQEWSGGTSFRPVSAESIGVVYAIGSNHVDLTVMYVDAQFDGQRFLNVLTIRIGLLWKALLLSVDSKL